MTCRILTADDPLVLAGQAAAGCLHCDAVPAQPAIPGQITYEPQYGWDAGAVSIQRLGGDCYTQFQLGQSLGVIVGFCTLSVPVTDPTNIDHGIYFATLGAASLFTVIERGVARTAPATRAAADVWRIERWNRQVRYLRNGAVVHVSTEPSAGLVCVGSRLYASGDQIE